MVVRARGLFATVFVFTYECLCVYISFDRLSNPAASAGTVEICGPYVVLTV